MKVPNLHLHPFQPQEATPHHQLFQLKPQDIRLQQGNDNQIYPLFLYHLSK